jgi:FtsP/CotA-like multicopper oxidase with cupredoxin domain
MNNPGVWILGAVDDDDREVGKMGIVVEYSGKRGRPQWIPPKQKSWDYLSFSGSIAETIPGVALPMVIERIKPPGMGMEEWRINGKTHDPATPTVIRSGTRYRLMVSNRSDDDHPLHLHRYSFELKSVSGKPTAGILKDVVVLRARAKLELEFTPDQPGLSLFHCHQMHMDNGFKTLFRVE